jgi:hypothetical protein
MLSIMLKNFKCHLHLSFYLLLHLYNFEVYVCQLFAMLMGMGPKWCTTTHQHVLKQLWLNP